jgi:hypothetical protein
MEGTGHVRRWARIAQSQRTTGEAVKVADASAQNAAYRLEEW